MSPSLTLGHAFVSPDLKDKGMSFASSRWLGVGQRCAGGSLCVVIEESTADDCVARTGSYSNLSSREYPRFSNHCHGCIFLCKLQGPQSEHENQNWDRMEGSRTKGSLWPDVGQCHSFPWGSHWPWGCIYESVGVWIGRCICMHDKCECVSDGGCVRLNLSGFSDSGWVNVSVSGMCVNGNV
jgi:hypothetical protein